MSKTIKFNLICDGFPVRTLEDLQEHFSVEDLLGYYRNGLLKRWLSVRGFDTELQKLESLDPGSDDDTVVALADIFGVETDRQVIKKSIYALQYREERQKLLDDYKEHAADLERTIAEYRSAYEQHFNSIVMAPNDTGLIKTSLGVMVNDYGWVLDMDYRRLFWDLLEVSPLAVLCLLMNEGTRKYYLPSDDEDDDYEGYANADKRAMYKKICALIDDSNLNDKLGDNLLSFSGETDGYWKDLQEKGRRYMILSMGDGDKVRSFGCRQEEFGQSDVNGKFKIVDGIDYKSNNASHTLLYMEV